MNIMQMLKKISGALVLALAVLGISACGNKSSKETESKIVEQKAKKVSVTPVSRQVVNDTKTFSSQIQADQKNNISTQIGGRIASIVVNIGDRVAKGQVLVRMDASQLNQARAQMEKAQRDYNRMNELYQVGGVSKMNWESAATALSIAQDQYHNLMQNTLLKSPINGVVTAKNFDNGDVAGPSMPILVVEQISPVKLLVNVSEQDYEKLKKKMPVEIRTDAIKDKIFQGTIRTIYPTIDPMTHTISIEINIKNQDQLLRPGMYATAQINFGTREILSVPDKAVLHPIGTGDRYVYVYESGKAIYRKVELGQLYQSSYEVLSGLNENAQVITSAVNSLTDGDTVEVEPK